MSGLKHCKFIISQSIGQKSGGCHWFLCSRTHGLGSDWRLWGRICFHTHPGCWQNSVPYGCRTEVPFPQWLSDGSPSQQLKATWTSSYVAHFSFKDHMGSSPLFRYLSCALLLLCFCFQPEKFLCF